jgi:hypothetical protein
MNTPQYKYKYREQKLDREDCIKMKQKYYNVGTVVKSNRNRGNIATYMTFDLPDIALPLQ